MIRTERNEIRLTFTKPSREYGREKNHKHTDTIRKRKVYYNRSSVRMHTSNVTFFFARRTLIKLIFTIRVRINSNEKEREDRINFYWYSTICTHLFPRARLSRGCSPGSRVIRNAGEREEKRTRWYRYLSTSWCNDLNDSLSLSLSLSAAPRARIIISHYIQHVLTTGL